MFSHMFLLKSIRVGGWRPPQQVGTPPMENPGSATGPSPSHQWQSISYSSEYTRQKYNIMPPKKLKSVVVPKNKCTRQVMSTTVQQGPPAKRTRNSKTAHNIVMTITQPVNQNTPTTTSNQPRASEAGTSHNTVLIVHPPAGVQHASNAAPSPGQHQPNFQQLSMP